MPLKTSAHNDSSKINQSLISNSQANRTNNTTIQNSSQMSGPPLSYANFTAPIIDFSFKNLNVLEGLFCKILVSKLHQQYNYLIIKIII